MEIVSFIDNILKHLGGLRLLNWTNAQCNIIMIKMTAILEPINCDVMKKILGSYTSIIIIIIMYLSLGFAILAIVPSHFNSTIK